MDIYSDFDGTIAQIDVTDLILAKLADPAWLEIEQAWKNDEISAADCMRRQVALIRASDDAIDAYLDQVKLDLGFVAFVRWAKEHGFSLTVVSDGVDAFIQKILGRHGLTALPIYANRLLRDGENCALTNPWKAATCQAGSGVCKCAIVAAPISIPRLTVFIGDGRSDECVAGRADLVFAKDSLAAFCERERIPYLPYKDFFDVIGTLSALIEIGQTPAFAGTALA